MENKGTSLPFIKYPEFGVIVEGNSDSSPWDEIPEMTDGKSADPNSQVSKALVKKHSPYSLLGGSTLKSKPLFPNMTANSGKESSQYKSPMVLSFDAYGNLTSGEDSDVPYSHEIPSLAEFDYILGSFEGNLNKKETEIAPDPSRNGTLKKTKAKKKHDSGNSEGLSDKDLKQVFKKDFDTTGSLTSRYGRTRKQKAQDEFFFGTINFNELRKITSPPKKNRHSSASDTKSDSESNVLENLQSSISQNFEHLADKIHGYSSEDEFVTEKEPSKLKQVSSDIDDFGDSHKSSSLQNDKEIETINPNKKRRKSDLVCVERMSRGLQDEGILKVETEKLDAFNLQDTETTDPANGSSYIPNQELKQIVGKTLALGAKGMQVEKLGSIQEDVNIIKSSLVDSKSLTSNINGNHDDKNNEDVDPADHASTLKKGIHCLSVKNDSLPNSIPTIIEMETLNEEVKVEEAPKPRRRIASSKLKKNQILEQQSHLLPPYKPAITGSAEDIELKTQRLNPSTYFYGDLVWVKLRGYPLWPGMISYSKDETEYCKPALSSPKIRSTGQRFHVQFFNDNDRVMWVNDAALLPYEGLPKLLSLMKEVKLIAHTLKNSTNLSSLSKSYTTFVNSYAAKIILKTSFYMSVFLQKDRNSHSKNIQWYQAIEEADVAFKMGRTKRQHYFGLKVPLKHCQKRLKSNGNLSSPASVSPKRVRSPSITAKKQDLNKLETSSFKSKSSDEFSGFDDTPMPLPKRLKIKDHSHKYGDFDVYLQKHLDSTMDDMTLSKEKAKKFLKERWQNLTSAQKSRYKSKMSYDLSLSSSDTDGNSSDSSHLTLAKSKKTAVQEEDGEYSVSKGTYRVPRNEKVCHLCEGSSFKSGADMIKCRGVCSSVFHLVCINLDVAPEGEFRCTACLSGIHKCFICKSEEGKKDRCSLPSCGKFYHSDCLKQWPQVSKARQLEKLVCPRHICHMCAANADDMNDPAARTSPFTRCLRCPTTYHTGEMCIAAGAEEISQQYHICTKHMKIPKNSQNHYNVNWCFCCSKGGSLLLCDQCPAAFHAECLNIDAPEGGFVCEDCEYGKFPVYGDIVWVKIGSYRWWPGEVLHPRYIPDNIDNLVHAQGMFCVHFFGSNDYYWMSRGRTFHYQEGDRGSKSSSSKTLAGQFKKALGEAYIAYMKQKEKRYIQEQSRSQKGKLKPPPYIKIDTNKPVGSVRLGKLDPSTITRCDCDPYSENPCGSDEKCINRMLMVECIREVCPAKDRCNNQRFQRRQYPHVYPFKTTGRGFGLKTKDFIKKGDFVIEYVGELIDEAEFRRRIEEMHEYKEENYYFLTVETDRMIDAGPKGNLARFMNHSCQPNCETQKWTVGADTRVGLFAAEDIPMESELTFNYNLQCVGRDKKKCNCGAPNCSGYIGVKVQKPDMGNLKNKKLDTVVKKRKRGRKKKHEKNSENECFRCGMAGDLLLCDIALCPKGYHLSCLELKELPKGKWMCPWHHCDECGRMAVKRCVLCPNSFCKSHSKDQFFTSPGLKNVCMDHSSEEVEAHKASEGSGSDSHSSREHSPDVPT